MASMIAADVCSEQLPSTSYSVATSESCRETTDGYSRQQTNDKQQQTETSDDNNVKFPIEQLPTELHLHILKNLPRMDIDNCKFVCRRWREMIYSNNQSLRKHVVGSLTLSALKSCFSLLLKCPNFAKKWMFCGNQDRGRRRHSISTFNRCAKIPHMIIYVDQTHTQHATDDVSALPLLVPAYAAAADVESSDAHDERKKREHTPPQLFFDKIAKHFGHANVKMLRFRDLRLTDQFVENLASAFGHQKIRCETLEIAFCKLKYISLESFERLLEMVECECLSLMWIRGNDGHISNSSVFLNKIAKCHSSCIFAITPEVPIGNDQLLGRFLDNPFSEKLLRLDSCKITNAGLLAALLRWKQSDRPLTINICVVSELLDFESLLRDVPNDAFSSPSTLSPLSSPSSSSTSSPPPVAERVCRISHPRFACELQLWQDELGCHLVTKNTINQSVHK